MMSFSIKSFKSLTAHPLIMKLNNKFDFLTAFYYALVGGSSAIVSFLSFALLWNVAHLDYQVAVTLSYIIAIIFRFFCNRHVTFKSADTVLIPQIFRYMLLIILNYLLTMLSVYMTVQWLHLSPYIGLIVSIVITTITGFILSKFWVFKNNTINCA